MNRKELLNFFQIEKSLTFDLYGNPDVRIDLSRPIPDEFVNHFSSVLEIGTFEHIINPYQALVNFDKMVAIDGAIIHLSPIKVKTNHGYYSISPQLLFDFYLTDGHYELLRADLISYFAGYESFLCPTVVTSYNL